MSIDKTLEQGVGFQISEAAGILDDRRTTDITSVFGPPSSVLSERCPRLRVRQGD
jgi:hypothetical protein